MNPPFAALDADEARVAAEGAGVPSYMAELNIFKTLLRHPRLARALNDLLGTLLFDAHLDARLRELVIMRVGWRSASVYEWTQHWRIARSLGIPRADLCAVREEIVGAPLGPAERAVIAAADDVLDGPGVRAETWARLRRDVSADSAVLLEVAAVAVTWKMIAELLASLDVPLEDALRPWPPDGRAGPCAGAASHSSGHGAPGGGER